jgi:hypothetical protein
LGRRGGRYGQSNHRGDFMNWIISLVVVYFLFSGEPPLIDILHDHVTHYLAQKEKARK